jgi:hypothetical protein
MIPIWLIVLLVLTIPIGIWLVLRIRSKVRARRELADRQARRPRGAGGSGPTVEDPRGPFAS